MRIIINANVQNISAGQALHLSSLSWQFLDDRGTVDIDGYRYSINCRATPGKTLVFDITALNEAQPGGES